MRPRGFGWIVCVILCSVVAGSAVSQIRVGLGGGPNVSNISMKTAETIHLEGEFNSMVLFNAGLVVEVPFSRVLALQTGVYFDKYGTSYHETYIVGDYHSEEDVDTRADFISIPVLAKYRKPLGPVNLYGVLGPYLALFMGGKAEGKIDVEYGIDADIDIDLKDGIKSLDYGLVAGIGVEKPIKGLSLSLDLRYKFGLSNDTGDLSMFSDDSGISAKSRILSANVGILGILALGK